MNTWAVILAAGRSTRFTAEGSGVPKQFLEFEDAPLFWRSAQTFARIPSLAGLMVVLPASSNDERADSAAESAAALIKESNLGLPVLTAFGGPRRQDSVRLGLTALPAECDTVLIHDAARPFASPALVERVLAPLRQGSRAVVPGLAVTDTIKRVDEEERVRETPNRALLRAVQTPQGFCRAALEDAHRRAEEQGWNVTDDASLMERCGETVLVVPGDAANRKITAPEDAALLSVPQAFFPCTGFGYDVHRYGGDRPFVLGGIPIATDIRIAAHSDGDTLLHALMDALLGCIGGGDIGCLFPDNDPAFDNISSGLLLAEVLERARRAGFTLKHADITIIAQTPRIQPFRERIAKNVASMLHLPEDRVNVKATTEEGLGFTGEKKGIKVTAVVTGLRKE